MAHDDGAGRLAVLLDEVFAEGLGFTNGLFDGPAVQNFCNMTDI